MAYLGALGPGNYADATSIAARIGAPPNYLGKLLRTLARTGLLDARKGAKGGFRLQKEASAIALFDILDPIEELVSDATCILGQGYCGAKSPCALHPSWAGLRSQILLFLHSTHLDSLIKTETSTR
jgi:Rrf2 family protein